MLQTLNTNFDKQIEKLNKEHEKKIQNLNDDIKKEREANAEKEKQLRKKIEET